ncbi:MAG: hypothetical protein JNL30_17300 [Rubrivivax sp.]|nr:hypothetical protein [Rubrivivax sp.]
MGTLLAGCASEAELAAPAAAGPRPWRTLLGGRVAPALPGIGLPTLPNAAPNLLPSPGPFIRFTRPAAVALRGTDLLVADLAGARLWRAELASESLTAIPGAPVSPETALALGPDLSAWVLDARGRRVLRYARDGRLAHTLPLPLAVPTPAAFALTDGGATLLVADGASAQWFEQRGSVPRFVQPQRESVAVGAGGSAAVVGSVDGLALTTDGRLQVLDRLSGQVHECTRDGRCLRSRGKGELLQPVALVLDRHGRVIVHDAHDNSLKRLADNDTGGVERWSAERLGVQRIGGIATDGALLAVSDAQGGRVVLLSLLHEGAP